MAKAIGLLSVSLSAGLVASCAAKADLPIASRPALVFVSDFNVSTGDDLGSGSDAPLGGISAIFYDAESARWVAVSDARRDSRFYHLTVDYDGSTLAVRASRTTHLVDERGRRFPENRLDPEGLARTPWGTLLVSTEPDLRREPFEQAKLLEFDDDGRFVRQLDVPAKFLVQESVPTKGVRQNLGFESLTVSPSGERLFVGGEEALFQDGAKSTFTAAAICRIIEFGRRGDAFIPRAEYAYRLGPISYPSELRDPELSTGLVELVALTDSQLLALERDYIRERAGELRGVNRARIFLVDVGEATDISSRDSLNDTAGIASVRKELLIDFDDIVSELSPEFRRLDNFEAMGLGPDLPDGGRTLLVVSDNNFSDRQRTAFLLFSFKAKVLEP